MPRCVSFSRFCKRRLHETPLHPSRASSRRRSLLVGWGELTECVEHSTFSKCSKCSTLIKHSTLINFAKHDTLNNRGNRVDDASFAQPVLAACGLVHPAGVQLRGGERAGWGREGRVTRRHGGAVSTQRRRGEESVADAASGGRIVSGEGRSRRTPELHRCLPSHQGGVGSEGSFVAVLDFRAISTAVSLPTRGSDSERHGRCGGGRERERGSIPPG